MTRRVVDGPLAWVLLIVHANWQLIAVVLCIALLVGVSGLAAGDPSPPTEAETVGALTVEIESADRPIEHLDNATAIPDKGIFPRAHNATLAVTARLEHVDESDAWNLTTEILTERRTRDGILWRRSQPLANRSGNPPISLSSTTNVTDIEAQAAVTDAHLDTSAGSLHLSLRAVASSDRQRVDAEIDIIATDEYIASDASVRQPITVSRAGAPEDRTGAIVLTAVGAFGVATIGAMRAGGRLPLATAEREHLRGVAARWRYRRHIIVQRSPIEVNEGIWLDSPAAVIRASRLANRPVRADDSGTLAVDIDGTSHGWLPAGHVEDP